MKKAKAVDTEASTLQPISEVKAASNMWEYYKENKAFLVSDIREHRDYILGQLMQGLPTSQVFLQFTKVEELGASSSVPLRSARVRSAQ